MAASVLGKRPLDIEGPPRNVVAKLEVPKSTVPCLFYARGTCAKPDCEYLHSDSNLAQCYACSMPGHYAKQCPNSARNFAFHDPYMMAPGPMMPPMRMGFGMGMPMPSGRVPRTPCKYFAQGTCTKGMACDWLHPDAVQSARTPCKYFLQGACKNGPACTWLHPGVSEAGGFPSMNGMGRPSPFAANKSIPCLHFARGMCTRPDCAFAHTPPGPAYAAPPMGPMPGLRMPYGASPMGAQVPRTPCKYFHQGLCTKGDMCTWLHA